VPSKKIQGEFFPASAPAGYFLCDCFLVLDMLLGYKLLVDKQVGAEELQVHAGLKEFKKLRSTAEAAHLGIFQFSFDKASLH
jgi:hypothetical protein